MKRKDFFYIFKEELKILICPDSFKGSLSSFEVADCIEKGLKKSKLDFESINLPLADGGDGTTEVLVKATGGKFIGIKVNDPLGREIKTKYGILGDGKTAIIEMAKASGLKLIPPKKRNPLKTSTYGTGQMIRDAIKKGYRKIIIGIGGSATVDGGVGMAKALGVAFLDKRGRSVGLGGGELKNIKKIDMKNIDSKVGDIDFIVCCDVKNKLLGRDGAARVYGPQKGATPEMVKILEDGLLNLANVIKRELNKDIKSIEYGGAAGGLGAGLFAFLGAKLFSGAELILKLTSFRSKLLDCDLIITGEGKIDFQTFYGKTVFSVTKLARKYNKRVFCIGGSISSEAKLLYKFGVSGLFSIINRPMGLDESMSSARELIIDCAENIGNILKHA